MFARAALQCTPSDPLGKALDYANKLWPRIRRYVLDGRYQIDNNAVDRGQRPSVMGRNDYVKKTIEYIDAYDEETLTDKAINDVSEKLATDIKSKMLSILFKKWKEDPNNKKVKECLEKHLSKDNMEKAGTLLGSENPAAVAWQFAKDFAVDKMKDFATQNPYVKAYVKAVQVEAKAINIAAKFFYQKRAEDMYKEFEVEYAHRGSDWNDIWNAMVIKYKNDYPHLTD